MIGTFWNLCRACPSMPVDKLHSEYRSTYRWHEYTGPHQEVVRRPPQGVTAPFGEKANEHQHTSQHEESTELPKLEPALPRRKKHPDLAYRHHEFLVSDGMTRHDGPGCSNLERARSEERSGVHSRKSRRSKSEGPARGSVLENADERRRDSDPDLENMGRDKGLLRKAISKISTEYRLQFAWPQGHTSRRDAVDVPKKSKSMGVINHTANGIINRKHIDVETRDEHELEPLVNDYKEKDRTYPHKKDCNTEYKKKFIPFSQYEYTEGKFTKRDDVIEEVADTAVHLTNGTNTNNESWYREVMELRKKAGEYKNRGWGSDLAPEKLADIYNKQVELWDQVSRRSSLSALSLASTTYRPYTKEEKDHENTKKSSPTKARMMRDMIKHHLERTTGGSEFDGLILSPTREKLEPTIPRNEDPRGSQKNSPKKNSPQKTILQKRNLQKIKTASQSANSTEPHIEKRSPKRQSRSVTAKDRKSIAGNESLTRRPRPSSLNTTASSRSKSSSSVPSKTEEDHRIAKPKSNKIQSNGSSTKDQRRKGAGADGGKQDKTETETPTVAEPETNVPLEPVVKSPPEPTRVKSPEQILMRSPDPVNWTVPLDTGKMFTVTQNVREGDILARPHSEVKAWTPPDSLPPVAQSAPPELSEQTKDQGMGLAVKV